MGIPLRGKYRCLPMISALQIIYRFLPPLEGSERCTVTFDERKLEGYVYCNKQMHTLLLLLKKKETLEDFFSSHLLYTPTAILSAAMINIASNFLLRLSVVYAHSQQQLRLIRELYL